MTVLVAATDERTDVAAYMRGKLRMAGVDADTPLRDALDCLQVVIMEVPVDELKKWRREFDSALWKIRPPDRSTWGLAPEQQAATARLTGERLD